MSNNKYIAHPGQSLEGHLNGVGEKSKQFASKLGLSQHGELIGLLHDLGKYSYEFQSYIRSAIGQLNPDDDEYVDAGVLKGKIDHSSAGAQYIWEAMSNKSHVEAITAQILALCIASHHSGLIDCIGGDSNNFGEDIFTRRMVKITEKTHIDEVRLKIDPAILERCSYLLKHPELTKSIDILIKKIAKTNSNIDITLQQIGLTARFLFSCLIDADRIDTADAANVRNLRQMGNYAEWPTLVERLENHLKNIKPFKKIDFLRRDISMHCLDAASRGPGTFTLTVPTGGGKTLASMRFALHHANIRNLDRIIYVIPYTSIIDQNAQVVREILEPENHGCEQGSIVLEHHSNLTPEQQTWHEKILCESWDAPVVYTTMVQLLESLFGSGTRGARRMHQLSNAVIIFDEIQNLPIKCVHLFNNAVNFLVEQCNSTVLLCTATQPLLHMVNQKKGSIKLHANHEIMPNVQKLFDELKRVEVIDRCKPGGWSCSEVAEMALNEFKQSNSCLIIVNTKNVAKEIYKHAIGKVNKQEIYHLSTDMCPAHRKQILSIITKRLKNREKVLCVCTQLIEAGVDVDFDTVIRSKSGLDSIAQAAGRCNRNGIRVLGKVYIVNISDERVEKLHDIYIGQRITERIIDDYTNSPKNYCNSLIGPQAIQDYYRYYFFERQAEMSYLVPSSNIGRDDNIHQMLSSNSESVNEYGRVNKIKPAMFLRQSFMTAANQFKAIDAPTQGVLVPYGAEGKHIIESLRASVTIEKEYRLLKNAQQFTVNVFPNVMQTLIKNSAIHKVNEALNIMFVDNEYYCDELGISTEKHH